MTVLYNDRTIPLALHASNPDLTTGLNLGWDFTEVDATHTDGKSWISPAAADLTKAGTPPLVTRYGETGRQMTNQNAWYTKSSATDFGIWDSDDWTFAVRIGMPASAPANSSAVGHLLYTSGDSGIGLSLFLNNVSGTGAYLNCNYKGSTIIGSGGSGMYLLPGKRYVIVLRRSGGTLSILQFDVETGTFKTQGSVAFTNVLDAAYAKNFYLGWHTTASGTGDVLLYSALHWTAALSDSVIQNNLGPDFYATWANSAVASTIGVTTPAAGATIGQTTTISGTSAGTAPTGVEVQFNGGAWTPLTGFTYSAGNWSGTVSGLAAGTGNIIARKQNEPATVSAAIANVTVQSDTIAITNVPPYRVFQRNLGTNSADIALSGTYNGNPTGIQWRLGNGAWTNLTGASIAGGVWSGTATGVPMGGGPIQVRFTNNVSAVGQVIGVSVGDIWICGGQSNMTNPGNIANAYTPANGLTASKYTHDSASAPTGSWAELTDPYDAQGSGQGSVITLLASYYLAAGIPVAFVPCAIGSTAIAAWQKGGGGYYDNMLARYNAIGASARGLLFWQGEGDAAIGTSQASYESLMNAMVNAWFNDTGLKTVVFRIHEGGPGSAAQHDAIREAQTLVGTNNTHAVLGPDPYGIETTDVHFTTPAKQQAVADRAWPCIAAEFYAMRKATVTLVSKNGVARANLRNLRYAFFDQATPATMAAPTATGGAVGLGLAADQNGQVKIPLPNSTLAAGQTGFLVLSDSTGNAATASNAYAAPVVVS